jgi:hypothetical protein
MDGHAGVTRVTGITAIIGITIIPTARIATHRIPGRIIRICVARYRAASMQPGIAIARLLRATKVAAPTPAAWMYRAQPLPTLLAVA